MLSDHSLKSDARLLDIAFPPIRLADVEASERFNLWVNRELSKSFGFGEKIAVILSLYRRPKHHIDDPFPGRVIKLQSVCLALHLADAIGSIQHSQGLCRRDACCRRAGMFEPIAPEGRGPF